MSLVKSIDGSNAASKTSDNDPSTGSVGMVGYTKQPYITEKPARANSDVGITKDSIGSLGNDGTNMSAYDEQKIDIGAENGK